MKNIDIKKITLKCDDCNWSKEVSDIATLNVGDRCPKCNSIIITQDDLDAMSGFILLTDTVNKLELNTTSDYRIKGTFGTRDGLKINNEELN